MLYKTTTSKHINASEDVFIEMETFHCFRYTTTRYHKDDIQEIWVTIMQSATHFGNRFLSRRPKNLLFSCRYISKNTITLGKYVFMSSNNNNRKFFGWFSR